MAIDTTVGGSASNSYVTVAEATDYFASHWSTTKTALWNGLSQAQQERLLMSATSVIETVRFLDKELGSGALPRALVSRDEYDITIHRLEMDQRLSFPRNLDIDDSGNGFVPQPVKDAECEQAVYMIAFDDSIISSQIQGIEQENLTAGPVTIHQRYVGKGSFMAPLALELLRPYIRPTAKMARS